MTRVSADRFTGWALPYAVGWDRALVVRTTLGADEAITEGGGDGASHELDTALSPGPGGDPQPGLRGRVGPRRTGTFRATASGVARCQPDHRSARRAPRRRGGPRGAAARSRHLCRHP